MEQFMKDAQVRSVKFPGQIPGENPQNQKFTNVRQFRQRHLKLPSQIRARKLSPFDLRLALVDYYISYSRNQFELRFFSNEDSE